MIKTKDIKQTVHFKTDPHTLFEMLMDSKKHSRFTGDKAKIEKKEGGKFSTFGGYATGVTLKLIEDKKIVQSWRGSDWPENHYSEITFLFAVEKGGTKLTFTQTGVPIDQVTDIRDGWKKYYWEPMKEMIK